MHLHMADRLAEMRFRFAVRADRAHGELGDLVVEVDQPFDDHAALVHATAAGGVIPRCLHLVRASTLDCPLPDDDITGLMMHG